MPRSHPHPARTRRRLVRLLGETVHHRIGLPRGVVRGATAPSAIPFAGETIPTYPYLETATDPLSPRPASGRARPVITGRDVTDFGRTEAVADPFLFVTRAGHWHMFFEVFDSEHEPTAAIGHATSPDGGTTWDYDGVVLSEPVHLSFPYVFEWRGERYMLPDTWSKGTPEATISLYRAREFPTDWTKVADLVSPARPMHDLVVFRRDGRWWGLAGDQSNLFVYHSDTLEADRWQPHERNPVVTDRPWGARPAGRPIVRDDYVLVFLQDCSRVYGEKVRAYRLTELSRTTYADNEVEASPILEPSGWPFGWNSGGMHHIDPWYVGDRWRCAVDGNIGVGLDTFGDMWAIGMYESR